MSPYESMKKATPSLGRLLTACFAFGAVPFSLALAHLSTDMDSPEVLRYALLASVPLIGLQSLCLSLWGPLKTGRLVATGIFVSEATWVPLEMIVYATASWGLRGRQVFALSYLPTLAFFFALWALVVGVVTVPLSLGLRRVFLNRAETS